MNKYSSVFTNNPELCWDIIGIPLDQFRLMEIDWVTCPMYIWRNDE